jgi:Ricin-type beta-trefoil lectin domain-like
MNKISWRRGGATNRDGQATGTAGTRTASGLRRTHLRLAAALLGALAVGATGLVAASPAQAAGPGGCNNRFKFVSSRFDLAVEDASTLPGARLVQKYPHGRAPELDWCITEPSGGARRIYNVKSGMCVTTDGIAGHTLTQQPCDGRWGQVWTMLYQGVSMSLPVYRIDAWYYPLTFDVYGDSRSEGAPVDAWYHNNGSNQLAYLVVN